MTTQDQERRHIEAEAVKSALEPFFDEVDGLTRRQVESKKAELERLAYEDDLNIHQVVRILGEIRGAKAFGALMKAHIRKPKE